MKVAGIVKNSIVDGPGIRYTIFAQGCPLKCEGCHNPATHDFEGGRSVDVRELAAEISCDPLLDGVTFTGGEPFAQAGEFAALADMLDMNIICYTGYTFEELYENPEARVLLEKVDVLIDGRFDKSSRSMKLKFRGSKNQRAIDSKESVRCGKAFEVIL
jgi:anaerobic ribonucleoside-triphosphate reductase activating protein